MHLGCTPLHSPSSPQVRGESLARAKPVSHVKLTSAPAVYVVPVLVPLAGVPGSPHPAQTKKNAYG